MVTKVGETVSFKLDEKLVVGKITGEGWWQGRAVFFIKYNGMDYVRDKTLFDTKTERTTPPQSTGGKY